MINYIVPEYRKMNNLMRDDKLEGFFVTLLKKNIMNTDQFEIAEVFYDVEANCIVVDFVINKEVLDDDTDEMVSVEVHYEVEFYSDIINSYDFNEDFNLKKSGVYDYKQFVVAQGYSILWKDNPYAYGFETHGEYGRN